MKKILLLLLLIIFPISVKADIKIIDHYIDAEIEIAGGLRVKELIVVEGSTDSFSRNINYKMVKGDWDEKTVDYKMSPFYNGYSLANVRVSAFEVPENVDFNDFGKDVDYFELFDYKLNQSEAYTIVENDLGSNVNIIKEIDNQKYAYYFEYLVTNVVVIHEDVAEINYTFKNIGLDADQTTLRVIIPYPTSEETYKLWVHGQANASLKELVDANDDKLGFILNANNLKSDINFRMTLPKDQVGIDIYLKHSNLEALNGIIKAENDQAEALKTSRTIKMILEVISIVYLVSSLILIKIKQNWMFYLYLGIGLLLMLLNFIFKLNVFWIYLIVLLPLLIKVIQTFRRK